MRRRYERVGSGAFADVFDLRDGSVLKAFHAVEVEGGDSEASVLAARICFQAEVRAYQKLQEFPDLEPYAPRFFGISEVSSILLDSERIYPEGCAIRLEKIPGTDVKIGALDPELLPKAVQER